MKICTIFVFLIFVIGFLLRGQEAILNNYLFLVDQGRDMMDVKQIVFDRHLTLIGPPTSLGGVFQGPLYYYLLAVPTLIFNGDPRGAVILMLGISMAVLFFAYFVTKKLFGANAALIALVLFVVSPEAIAAATYSWNPHPMWLVITIYIFILYLAHARPGIYLFLLWPVVFLSFHFQTAFGVFLALATVIYVLIFNRPWLRKATFWKGVIFAIILISPQILFDLRHDFLMTKSVVSLIQGSDRGLFFGGENLGLTSLIKSHVAIFRQNFISSFPHQQSLHFVPAIIILVCVVILLVGSVKSNEKRFLSILFLVVSIIFLLSFVYPFPIRSWFLTGFQTFYLLAAAVILSKLFLFRLGKVFLIFLFGVLLLYSSARINKLYFHPPDYGGTAKARGKLDAIDFIYRDAAGKEFGLLVFTPPIITDAYDYLVWWRRRARYGYIPHTEKKGLVYLLMEPDPAKTWSYQGWLETVIKTGKILETTELSSGLIVQKRYF